MRYNNSLGVPTLSICWFQIPVMLPCEWRGLNNFGPTVELRAQHIPEVSVYTFTFNPTSYQNLIIN